jgi:hypothetical protein
LQKISFFHEERTMITAEGKFISDADPHTNPNFRYR